VQSTEGCIREWGRTNGKLKQDTIRWEGRDETGKE